MSSHHRPVHKVWGEPEVLSCYSSSGTSPSGYQASGQNSRGQSSKERKFPKELQQYLRQNVAKVTADASGSSSGSEASAQRARRRVPGAGSSGARPSSRASSSTLRRVVVDARVGAEGAEAAPSSHASEAGAASEQCPSSAGSSLHYLRQCKPCMYVSSSTGCIKGLECQYCHLDHPKKSRPRPSKATRLQCKQLASMLDVLSPDAEQMKQVTELLGDNNAYMRAVLKGRQKQLAEGAGSRAEGWSVGDAEDEVIEI